MLLLAIQPIRILGGGLGGGGSARWSRWRVLASLLAGMHAPAAGPGTPGTALQVLLLAGGLLHWSLAVLGPDLRRGLGVRARTCAGPSSAEPGARRAQASARSPATG